MRGIVARDVAKRLQSMVWLRSLTSRGAMLEGLKRVEEGGDQVVSFQYGRTSEDLWAWL